MFDVHTPEIGGTVSIQKPVFNDLLARLREAGFETLGPRVKDGTLVYEAIDTLADLPRGYSAELEAGRYRLVRPGHDRYFDVISGQSSWKQFLFPPRLDLFAMQKIGRSWEVQKPEPDQHNFAFIGVRGCDLAAIQVQDKAFIREDFHDPIYLARRERVFILAVDCLRPGATCFCASMGTGPRPKGGFDLRLTELDGVFLITIGSELGRRMMAGLPYEAASAFVMSSAERGIEQAAQSMGRELDTSDLPDLILNNLDADQWDDVAKRCLSCGNCTQACPTCFCWDATDQLDLTGTKTKRVRVWDSCFNPDYSYQAGGNTRPNIRSRYRQWLSHKLGTWVQQYGTFGCVGCGRCIVWCPAGIDLTKEIPALRKETVK
ncbi:MAG TPA: 4Fe-4S dicluster domain-containing protein [Anaerolineales bacterium]|nr:4Fe-4S dicluster domain-containing protein [Anaerolineales bacterium]